MATNRNEKKRHHYVPATYLNRFTNSKGKVYAYRKDGPYRALDIVPDEIAFERYYYSQPIPEGGQDNNTLEDLFSDVEMHWPEIVDSLILRRSVSDRSAEMLFSFVSLLRVRVPAARDPVELLMAYRTRQLMAQLAEAGELPPPPLDLSYDDLEIAIDPHQSIHAMVSLLHGMAKFWECVGIEVVHNRTSVPFATSDNPVVYFDPTVPEEKVLPYTVQLPNGAVELLMPISPTVLLRGRHDIPIHRPGDRLRHVEMTSRADVCRVNRFMARFGYRFVFASHNGLETFVAKYAALSPTVRFDVVSDGDEQRYDLLQMVFGNRPKKPKWRGQSDRSPSLLPPPII